MCDAYQGRSMLVVKIQGKHNRGINDEENYPLIPYNTLQVFKFY